MSKRFKYQDDMDAIKAEHGCDCPNKKLIAISSLNSFRYVFEDINNKRNFLPQLKDDPARFIDANDGLVTEEGYLSHFELYEFENVELKNKFQIIEKL